MNNEKETQARATSASPRVEQFHKFIPVEERDALYAAACANQLLFHPPAGPGTEIGSTLYWSTDQAGSDTGSGSLHEAVGVLESRILDVLPSLFTALDIDPFPVSKVPLSLISGLDGHSGSPHADSLDGRFKISLLYYLHGDPKVFRGGDLEIFRADPTSSSGHGDEAIMTIEHEDNLLAAFKSETFHGVTDVHCPSSEFADGRLVAVAFIG